MRISIIRSTASAPHAVELERLCVDRGHHVTIDAVVLTDSPVTANASDAPCLVPGTFNPLGFRASLLAMVRIAADRVVVARGPDLVLLTPGAEFIAAFVGSPPHPRMLAVIDAAQRSMIPARLPRGVRVAVHGAAVGDTISLSNFAAVERWAQDGASTVAAWRRELSNRTPRSPSAPETLAFRLDEEPQD